MVAEAPAARVVDVSVAETKAQDELVTVLAVWVAVPGFVTLTEMYADEPGMRVLEQDHDEPESMQEPEPMETEFTTIAGSPTVIVELTVAKVTA